MNVYISVDMEGVAGVAHEDQTDPINPAHAVEYARFRRLMTDEANAAIQGATSAGASRILVNDSHWLMRNLLAEELHETAELISSGPKRLSMMEGRGRWVRRGDVHRISRHGRHEARDDRPHLYRQDPRGEAERPAGGRIRAERRRCGRFGVPVVMVSGDQALAVEAHALLGVDIETVVVKEASVGSRRAACHRQSRAVASRRGHARTRAEACAVHTRRRR